MAAAAAVTPPDRLVAAATEISTNYTSGGLCYTGEASGHNWDKYAGLLTMAFRTIEEGKGTAFTQTDKVQRLLDGILVTNQLHIDSGKDHVMKSLMDDYDSAVSHMATQVALAYPSLVLGKHKIYWASTRLKVKESG